MILLDTHILVWLLIAPENLSPKAKKAILAARKSGPLALSAISLWEIAWLAVNKRIDIDVSVDSFVKKCASYVQVLPITPEIVFGKLVWPISAVCFGPPPWDVEVWETFIPWSSWRWECGNRC